MPKQNNIVTKNYLDTKLKELKQALDEKLDWLIGEYRKHAEEHILLSNKVSEHSDRLEVVEEKLDVGIK